MKKLLLFLTVLLSISVFACKCNEPTIRSSFESADFVFIGEVYEVNDTYKTGYLEVENALSRVKINEVFKTPGNHFKSAEVTFFGQQFNSCDLMFRTKGKYLIFAYIEPDTTFFYSSHCLATKMLSQVTASDYQLLQDLQKEYVKEVNAELPEDYAFSNELRTPDKIINDLKFKNKQVLADNKNLKINLIVLAVLLVISLIVLLLKLITRNNR